MKKNSKAVRYAVTAIAVTVSALLQAFAMDAFLTPAQILPSGFTGVARLVEGMRAEDAIQKIQGIRCGYKATSCPDQLSKALQIALAEEAKRKQ